MTLVVTTAEGRRIAGETALDVVREMNDRALIGEPDAWRYMAALARRVRRLTGSPVRTTSPDAFLADLAALGYLSLDPQPGRETG